MRTWRSIIVTGLLLAVAAGCTAGGGTTRAPGPSPSVTGSPVGPGAPVPSPSGPAPSGPAQDGTSPASPAPTGTGPTGSGITGRVTIDGGCPVVTEKGCPDRPYIARIVVAASSSGPVVASVLTGSDGTYRIALPAGRYAMRVGDPQDSPYPRPVSVTVAVVSGKYTTEDVRLDSGIR